MDTGVAFHLEPIVRIAAEAGKVTHPAGRAELSTEEQRTVQAMQQRDREVKAHEQAHLAAGGACVTGGPSYAYQVGPDGKRYAVGGEVPIDTSEVPNDPGATIRKMAQVRRAALAPKDPSAADRRVASVASKKEADARRELREKEKAEREEAASPDSALVRSAVEAYGRGSEYDVRDSLVDILA